MEDVRDPLKNPYMVPFLAAFFGPLAYWAYGLWPMCAAILAYAATATGSALVLHSPPLMIFLTCHIITALYCFAARKMKVKFSDISAKRQGNFSGYIQLCIALKTLIDLICLGVAAFAFLRLPNLDGSEPLAEWPWGTIGIILAAGVIAFLSYCFIYGAVEKKLSKAPPAPF